MSSEAIGLTGPPPASQSVRALGGALAYLERCLIASDLVSHRRMEWCVRIWSLPLCFCVVCCCCMWIGSILRFDFGRDSASNLVRACARARVSGCDPLLAGCPRNLIR